MSIFISYRRDDSRGFTGRIADRLEAYFGKDRVFRDVTSLHPGEDFAEAIKTALHLSDVLLAVIGDTGSTSPKQPGNAVWMIQRTSCGSRSHRRWLPIIMSSQC